MSARDAFLDYVIHEMWGPVLPVPEDSIPLQENNLLQNGNGKKHYLVKTEEKYPRFHDPETMQSVLISSSPETTYGTGILHAPDSERNKKKKDPDEDFSLPEAVDLEEEQPTKTISNFKEEGDEDSFNIDESQRRRPRAKGLSFEATISNNALLEVSFSGAIYEAIEISVNESKPRPAWKRQAIEGSAKIKTEILPKSGSGFVELNIDGEAKKYVDIVARFRRLESDTPDRYLVTVVVKNNAANSAGKDVFQSELTIESKSGVVFHESENRVPKRDEDAEETAFIFRDIKRFARGHGTAVEWDTTDDSPSKLWTVSIPKWYQQVLDFSSVGSFSMSKIAESTAAEIEQLLTGFIGQYDAWIQNSKHLVEEHLRESEVLDRLVSKAEHISGRMRKGLDLLVRDESEKVGLAFSIANKAMFEQQRNGKRFRDWKNDGKAPFQLAEAKNPDPDTFGRWRPFQLAFLLTQIPGIVDPSDDERDEVDLIYFPTGGGKTEAYLGVAAFSIVYERLTKPNEELGVNVLMRYTLRLLTVQQFERACGLVSALESIRKSHPALEMSKEIEIGIWLGRATTPNKRADAVNLLGQKPRQGNDTNPFILSRCPACGTKFGRDPEGNWRGYKALPNSGPTKTLRFSCVSDDCEYSSKHNPLPIWITDEDVYDRKPAFLLATVDKFARIAWEPKSRSIFNIGDSGERIGPPPTLIIQDELHLISGPLGSMSGLYETTIDYLCTDFRHSNQTVRPKIITSTATTNNFRKQIKHLFNRDSVMVFPQAIHKPNETFFSSVDRDPETGNPKRGTCYVGLNPATISSGQAAAAKVSAVLLQASNVEPDINDKAMDYYRTTVWFLNSIKDLGMTLTLMNSTVRDTIGGLRLAGRLPQKDAVYPSRIMELTSRIDSNKIASSLTDLGKPSWEKDSYKVCLASSIMEVGVDVPRLGLMAVMGQPKTVSQYIQVTGRVGRSSEGPGLVFLLSNTARGRDRGVYEDFMYFHSSLYANVEPTSVTPFAIEAMNKGLRGALVGLYRLTSEIDAKPNSIDWQKFKQDVEVFLRRLNDSNQPETARSDFNRQVDNFILHAQSYTPPDWSYPFQVEKNGPTPETNPALMRGKREPLHDLQAGDQSIMAPTSMRSVDGVTELRVKRPFFAQRGMSDD